MLPLDLMREMNTLKYWARSYRLGPNLQINNSITVDPICEHKFHARKTFKLPYTQKIQLLLKEYGFHNIQIQGPVYEIKRNFTHSSIDFSLVNKISKNKPDRENLVTANLHLRCYQKRTHIYIPTAAKTLNRNWRARS